MTYGKETAALNRVPRRTPACLGKTAREKFQALHDRARHYRSACLNVAGLLLTLIAIGDFESHFLAFSQGFETVHIDRGKMREEVLPATVRGDESETFCVIKPFHCTTCHVHNPKRVT